MTITKNKQGFTLVEMMVVIGIFLIVTGVILINVPNFREKTSVDLVAQDIAVTIRSSQVFGVGTRALNGNLVAYGVSLSTDPDKKGRFVLFADLPTIDYKYTPGSETTCGQSTTECQSEYSLNGFTISDIYIYKADGIIEPQSQVDISFERPKSNPRFCVDEGENCPDNSISKVEIVVESLKEKKRKVVAVYANGQIAVEDFVDSSTTQ
ncbi:MAG: type II secretion system GspH family protein [Candidatus Vogelbacteria bacterium]|nr:type II secretion system GspH family protein [Candidatus Vogelbacteria bacterium]